VPVYELGLREDGRPYFTMKLVRGRTLAALLDERADPTKGRPRYVSIFEQICQTIAYAHSRGVVHRDLKPSNVMVGSFGEVLVVDWGLAKVLTRGGIADERRSKRKHAAHRSVTTVRTGPGSTGTESIAGSVFGTPAYMSPEQARGDIDVVDERSDVFSLGSILCELLTGTPCFTGSTDVQLRKAADADLDDAYRRIDASGVPAALIRLAKKCLSPEIEDRPRNAGVVSKLLTRFLATFEEQARRAQIDAAEARGKTAEERRAKRLVTGLAATIVITVVMVSIGYWMHARDQHDQMKRSQQAVFEALRDASRLESDNRLDDALVAMNRARLLISTSNLDANIRREVDAASHELDTRVSRARFLEKLDALRTVEMHDAATAFSTEAESRAIGDDQAATFAARDEAYAVAFAEHGVDIDRLTIFEAAEAIRGSGIAVELCLALDSWAINRGYRFGDDSEAVNKLITIAIAADDDPFRVRMRNAYLHNDVGTLEGMVGEVTSGALAPVTLGALSHFLYRLGNRADALAVLLTARERYPADFGTHFSLGLFYMGQEQWREAEQALQIARALRPDSVDTLINLSRACRIQGRNNDAIALLERARQLRSDHAMVHRELGRAYDEAGASAAAIDAYAQALRLQPRSVRHARRWLSAIAKAEGTAAALAALDVARQEHPDNIALLLGAAVALRRAGDLERALTFTQQAITLEPESSDAQRRMGRVLFDLNRRDEAIRAFETALQLDPQNTDGYFTYTQVSELTEVEDL